MDFSAQINEIKNNPHLLPIYAKPSCKKCYGRGYLVYSYNIGGVFLEERQLCTCIISRVKKEQRDGENSASF